MINIFTFFCMLRDILSLILCALLRSLSIVYSMHKRLLMKNIVYLVVMLRSSLKEEESFDFVTN